MNEVQRLLHEPAVFRLGLTLVHFLWQGAAFGLLALLVLVALRHARPVTRYLALLVLFGLMAASPVVTYSLTKREPQPLVITKAVMARLLAETAKVRSLSRAASAPTRAREPLSHVARVKLLREWRWVRLRLPVGVMLWCAGVLALALRLLLRWRALSRIRGRAAALEGGVPAQVLAVVAVRLGVQRTVRLLESALVQVPTVIGWLRPAILLPACALTGLTPEQLEAVIAHEVAHIRRHDFLVNILQTAVETLLFFHPVVWWLSHRIRAEREQCCDDLAVMVCGDAFTYARALAELEQLRARAPEPALAAVGGSLTSRVLRLVASDSNTRPLAPWLAAALPALAVAFFLLAPTLARIAGASSLEGTLLFVDAKERPDGGGANYVTHILRGGTERVMPDSRPRERRWSDDFSPVTGEVIYHYGFCSDGVGIWKANPDGSDPVELTRVEGVGGVNCWPKWSPDGTMITFSHDNRIWVMKADGSGARQVTDLPAVQQYGTGTATGSWSPDSSRLLASARFERSAYGVTDSREHRFAVDVRSGQVRVLPGATRGRGVWSPDGAVIADAASEAAALDGKTGEWQRVVLTDQDGNNARVLFQWFVTWEEVRAHHSNRASAEGAMRSIGPRNLTWSPSGDEIAFAAAMPYDPSLLKGGGQGAVFVCDVRTGGLTRITHDAVYQESITWRE